MKTENPNTPIFGTPEEARVAPKFEMPKTSMPGEVAYQLVHDEAMMDGNARLNLATFVTTWMDDYARRVMTENMDKNMIDKTEYPQTAEIERRCVNIIAKLWHSPEPPYCTGTSTVGSSEACMLGGIAALKRDVYKRQVQDAEQDTRDNDSYPAVFEEQGRPLHEVSPEKQLLKRGLKRKKE